MNNTKDYQIHTLIHPIAQIISDELIKSSLLDEDSDTHDNIVILFHLFTKEYITRFVNICSIYLDHFKMNGGITYKIARIALTSDMLLTNISPPMLYTKKFRKAYENRSKQDTDQNDIDIPFESKQVLKGIHFFEKLKIKQNNKYFKISHIQKFISLQYAKLHNKGKYPISKKAKMSLIKCIEYDTKFILKKMKDENCPITIELMYSVLDKLDMRLIV